MSKSLNPNSSPINVTVVGGGSSAHVICALLGSTHTVRLLVLPSEVASWKQQVSILYQQKGVTLKTFCGKVAAVSANAADVIPQADYVFLCMPVGAYRTALMTSIGPHISREKQVFVGAVYGQAGVNWMVTEMTKKFSLPRVVGFAIGLIPWICRISTYGSVGVCYGEKPKNLIALQQPHCFLEMNRNVLAHLCEIPFGRGKFFLSPNFLSLTLSVDNQIIHPARCYGLYQKSGGFWEEKTLVPYFYRDFDDFSVEILSGLDADYELVRSEIRRRFPSMQWHHMLDYMGLERYVYGGSEDEQVTTSIKESFTESVQLAEIKPPLVLDDDEKLRLDTNHRFFHDDIHYGLCVVKWIAEKLELTTVWLDKIITWAQEMRGERLLENGRLVSEGAHMTKPYYVGLPSVYGFSRVEEILG